MTKDGAVVRCFISRHSPSLFDAWRTDSSESAGRTSPSSNSTRSSTHLKLSCGDDRSRKDQVKIGCRQVGCEARVDNEGSGVPFKNESDNCQPQFTFFRVSFHKYNLAIKRGKARALAAQFHDGYLTLWYYQTRMPFVACPPPSASLVCLCRQQDTSSHDSVLNIE